MASAASDPWRHPRDHPEPVHRFPSQEAAEEEAETLAEYSHSIMGFASDTVSCRDAMSVARRGRGVAFDVHIKCRDLVARLLYRLLYAPRPWGLEVAARSGLCLSQRVKGGRFFNLKVPIMTSERISVRVR